MPELLNEDVATKEFTKWMDAKKIRTSVREDESHNIKSIIEGFKDGILILNEETNEITQKLIFPIEGLKELVFTPRLKVSTRANMLKNAGLDADSRVIAMIGALTGQNTTLLSNLDVDDINASRGLTAFFF